MGRTRRSGSRNTRRRALSGGPDQTPRHRSSRALNVARFPIFTADQTRCRGRGPGRAAVCRADEKQIEYKSRRMRRELATTPAWVLSRGIEMAKTENRNRRDLSSAFLLKLIVLLAARLSSCSAAPAFPTDRPQFCRPVTRPHLGFFAPKIPPRDSDLLSSQPFIFRPFAHDTATPRAPLSSHGHPTLPGSQPSFVTYRARLLADIRLP